MDNKAAILVVDDEPSLRQTLGLILQQDGYQVTLAADGNEALQCLNSGKFDLAFLDLKLPDVNGLDLLPRIHQITPDLPVLILTAHATLESAMEAVRQGARDYLLKPAEPATILQRTKEILSEQKEPLRRREIISQVQGLLSELRQMDDSTSSSMVTPAAYAAVDPDRFIKKGKLTVDLHTRHLLVDKKMVIFPPTTFDYMVTLMRHSPEAVSFEKLVQESQAYDLTRMEAREMTRWHIHKIRKALEQDPSHPNYIITVRDFGYRLVV